MSRPGPRPAPAPEEADEARRILNRLKRVEGQIRGLQTMVERGKDCRSLLTQVTAARSALNQVGLLIMARSMRDCLSNQDASSGDEAMDEALSILMRYVDLPEGSPAPEKP